MTIVLYNKSRPILVCFGSFFKNERVYFIVGLEV